MTEKKFKCFLCGHEFSATKETTLEDAKPGEYWKMGNGYIAKCPECSTYAVEISPKEDEAIASCGCPTDEIKKKFNEVLENEKKAFFCPACAHKDVCNKVDEQSRQCENFLDATEPQRYPSIYHMFQPIFDWLKYHYPSGEVKFIVDQSSAKMFIEHGPSAFSKEITDMVCNTKKTDNEDTKGQARKEQQHGRI